MTSVTAPAGSRHTIVADYLQLTKPKVVLLLIFTTITAMVVAAQNIFLNPLTLIATLVGGSLSAVGASVLNQYLERDLDCQMTRTRERPLPAGRIVPINALLFGLALLVVSTLILAVVVNWLTAALAVIGAIYYVVVYTLVLKRNTALNIIVGGGAGAMPVLVGWAAATGHLAFDSFLLFALIFFWTPPHSWALAVMIENDYARGEIPMLPVALGSEITRWQIVWYSLLLVVLTLLPLPLGMRHGVYFAAAIVLGAGLLYRALRLLEQGTKAAARQMYKYSSGYLALLFLTMIVDRLLFR